MRNIHNINSKTKRKMITLIKKKGINPQDKSTLYFPQWTRVSTVTETQLAKRMARGSTFSVGEVNGVFADFPQSIIDELLDGVKPMKSVLPGSAKPSVLKFWGLSMTDSLAHGQGYVCSTSRRIILQQL